MNRHEFQALYRSRRDLVFRFLLRLCRNRSDAEDLLQETFLAVWRKRRDFRGQGSQEGYLRKTAFRLYLNRSRRRSRRAALAREAVGRVRSANATQEPTVDGSARGDYHRVLRSKMQLAIASLPDGAREVFLMFRFEGLTCAEIAELSRTPVKTVESRLRRATRLVARAVESYRRDLVS